MVMTGSVCEQALMKMAKWKLGSSTQGVVLCVLKRQIRYRSQCQNLSSLW